MKEYPSIENGEEQALDVMTHDDTKKVCVTEYVEGEHLRFKPTPNGILYGYDKGVCRDEDGPIPIDSIKTPERYGVRHINSNLNVKDLDRANGGYGGLTFYGVVPDKSEYDDPPRFLGHGVWIQERERWLAPRASKLMFDNIGLEHIRVYTNQKLKKAADYFIEDGELDIDALIGDSGYRDGPAAGVVVQGIDGGGDTTTAAHVENDVEVPDTTDHPQSGVDPDHKQEIDESRLVTRMVTQNRVTRLANNLIEDGEYDDLDMDMMKHLHEDVYLDILSDKDAKIYYGDYTVNFENFHKAVAKRTAKVLSQMIDRRKVSA